MVRPAMGPAFSLVLCRWFVAIVFITAAAGKILDPGGFAEAVFRYQILPHALVNLAALFLPWLELILALVLIARPTYREASALLILVLLAAFTVSIGANLARGIDVACGCFTTDPDAEGAGWRNIFRNAGLMVLTAAVFWDARRRRQDPAAR